MTLFYILMELHYYYFVGVRYEAYLMKISISIEKYIETKILFFLLMTFSIFIYKKSEFIFSIFIFFSIFFLIPGLITYSFQDQIPAPLYSIIALLISIGLISVHKIQLPFLRAAILSHGVVGFSLILLMVPLIYSYGLHFNLNNFLLTDIHLTREIFNENSSTLVNYLYNWLVRAIIPVLVIYFLLNKQHRYSAICLFIMLYLYIVSGNKTVYITVFVVLFFYFVGKDEIEKIRIFLLVLVLALMIIPIVDSYILNSHTLKGTFIMRMLFLPSNLNYLYFDLFKDDPIYFSESSFFKWFSDYPFNKPVGFIISEKYFALPDMNSNNGIISDGYMNLGYWGIAINILLVSLLFLLFNSVSLDPKYLGIFFLIIFLFLSSPMLSMFTTSGLWILILLAFTIKKDRKVLT